MQRCPTCSTPLDEHEKCITCSALGEGLVLVDRLDYGGAQEVMSVLQEAGLGARMEKVPPGNEREQVFPRWNVYVGAEEGERAAQILGKGFRDLLLDEDAVEAARRGRAGVDLDAGGEITCPACGHVFVPSGELVECPDCGLGLGAPGGSE